MSVLPIMPAMPAMPAVPAMSATHRMLFVQWGLTMVQSMTQRPLETQSLLEWLLMALAQELARELVQAQMLTLKG